MTATTETPEGPAWTIAALDVLDTGGRRVLIRLRGGRLIRLSVPADQAVGPTIEALIPQVIKRWPPPPGPDTYT